MPHPDDLWAALDADIQQRSRTGSHARPYQRQQDAPNGPRLHTDASAPDFAGLAASQADAALEHTTFDATGCIQLPWTELHSATGPLLPWQWWILAAMTGQGKSTMLMSLVAHWIAEERPVYMLPLEQPADVMRLTLAALRRGLDPRFVLGGRWDRLPANARDWIAADLAWQKSDEGAALLHFNPAGDVGAQHLPQLWREAQAFGAEVLLIDHLHNLDDGGTHAGFRRLCQALNDCPKHFRIPVLTAAQMHRGDGDRVMPHMPPRITGIQGGDVARQYAHIVLGAYRPFSGRPSRSDEARIRKGDGDIRDFLEPNCVGVHVMKQRIDGEQQGRIVRLRYDRGAIVNPTNDQLERWQAQANL